jgi:cobalt-zinc-cadmium efflux system outer membrane protein
MSRIAERSSSGGEVGPRALGRQRKIPSPWPRCAASALLPSLLVVTLSSAVWAQHDIGLQMPSAVAPPAESLPTPLPAAEDICGLTLEQLEQMALAGNPSLRRAAALVAAARGTAVQVGLAPNPGVGYEGQQLGSGGLAEQHGVLFSQEIVRGGKLRLNRAVANSERVRLEQEFAAQEQRVLTDVRIAYYQVLLAQRQIDLTNDLIRISRGGAEAVDALFRANEVGRADILQAQLETETAQIFAQNAVHRHDSAWRSLAAIIGDPNLQPQPLEGSAAKPAREFVFQEALARLLTLSPEIAAASAAVDRARLALERERVEPIPNVDVQGVVNVIDNGIGGKTDGGIAVSFPIPIFNRNQGAIARGFHELIATREALSQLELDLQNRLAPVFELYANARNQVQRYDAVILPAAQESLELTQKMYGAGETNYTTLLTAQRTYSQTHLNYLDAVRSLRIAEVEIDGLLLSGSLNGSEPRPGGDRAAIGGPIEPIGAIGLFPR